jgi:hypothetical protein
MMIFYSTGNPICRSGAGNLMLVDPLLGRSSRYLSKSLHYEGEGFLPASSYAGKAIAESGSQAALTPPPIIHIKKFLGPKVEISVGFDYGMSDVHIATLRGRKGEYCCLPGSTPPSAVRQP